MATDERIVSLSSNYSNTGMIKRELINQITRKHRPHLIELYPQRKDEIKNQLELLEEYISNNIPEIAFLGIGKDGHTAGIFEQKTVKSNFYTLKNLVDPFYRITISMDALIKIPYLIFFVLGPNKKDSLKKILLHNNSKKFLPAKFLIKNGLGEKIIFCDRQAAPSLFNIGESRISFNNESA